MPSRRSSVTRAPSWPAQLQLEDFQGLKLSLSGDFCSRVEQSQVTATLSNCAPSSKEIQSIARAEEAADAAIPGWGRTANGVEFVPEVRDALMPGPCLEDGPTDEVGALGSCWAGVGRDGPVISVKSAMSGIGSSILSSETIAVGSSRRLSCLHAFSRFFIRFPHSMAKTNF